MNNLPVGTISALEKEILQEFEKLDSVDNKYLYLFKLGELLPEMDASLRTEQSKVKGCQSSVWFDIAIQNGVMSLQVDSDSMLIKGILALLVRLVEGRPPSEVVDVNLNFLDNLSIWKMASDQNPGLIAILEHLHSIARLSPVYHKTADDVPTVGS